MAPLAFGEGAALGELTQAEILARHGKDLFHRHLRVPAVWFKTKWARETYGSRYRSVFFPGKVCGYDESNSQNPFLIDFNEEGWNSVPMSFACVKAYLQGPWPLRTREQHLRAMRRTQRSEGSAGASTSAGAAGASTSAAAAAAGPASLATLARADED